MSPETKHLDPSLDVDKTPKLLSTELTPLSARPKSCEVGVQWEDPDIKLKAV